MSISNNINILKQIKANLKNAIESKGEDLTNVPFTNYSKKIDAIETSGDLVAPLTLQEDTLLALEKAFDNLETPKADLDYTMQMDILDNIIYGYSIDSQKSFKEDTIKIEKDLIRILGE